MVPLRRGEAPNILRTKATQWTAAYLAQCAAPSPPRPNPKHYGHAEVRTELRRMSHNKCFYCEVKLAEGEDEVDHHVEVSARRDLAFTWENLYLACPARNGQKSPDARIANADCIDPCDPARHPADHLAFENELAQPRDNRGRATITKYRLDRDGLDLKRGRHLRAFMARHRDMQACAMREHRDDLSDPEKELLRRYRDPSMPFSLMMDGYLRALGL